MLCYRKERSKRPHQSKHPGAPSLKTKNENCPGGFVFALFREEGPVGRAHDSRRCAIRTCYRSGEGRFAACSGRNSTGIFFSLHIYSSIQVFFNTFVSRPVDSTRPDQHFFSFCAFCPIFVLKNAPGALSRNCFMKRPGGRLLRSLR